jgi:hypothetical protein
MEKLPGTRMAEMSAFDRQKNYFAAATFSAKKQMQHTANKVITPQPHCNRERLSNEILDLTAGVMRKDPIAMECSRNARSIW